MLSPPTLAVLPGENCERTWAELAHHGLVTKYMAGDNRECRLERAAHLLNRGQDNQTSSLLTQMTKRVEEELVSCSKETDAELEGLKELLLEQASPPADVSDNIASVPQNILPLQEKGSKMLYFQSDVALQDTGISIPFVMFCLLMPGAHKHACCAPCA